MKWLIKRIVDAVKPFFEGLRIQIEEMLMRRLGEGREELAERLDAIEAKLEKLIDRVS